MERLVEKIQTLPPVGLRMVKSAVCVFLCFLLCSFRGDDSTLFQVVLAGLWCIQPNLDGSRVMGWRRLLGTLIGAAFGLVVLPVELWLWTSHGEITGYLLASVMLIPILYTTVLIGKTETSFYSCVVFLSITNTYITDANPYFLVWNRTLDTVIGLAVGLAVNAAHIPRHYRRDRLFVLQLEDALLGEDGKLTPYGKVELNNMLAHGAKLTVATAQTPATLMPPLRDLQLNLPVVAMDGAVLYDIRTKTFLHSYVISQAMTRELNQFLTRQGYHHFANVVMEDMLVIYYQDFQCPAAEQVYRTMRTSPYRNYVHGEIPEGAAVVYFLVVEEKPAMERLRQLLEQAGYGDSLKLSFSEPEEFPGHVFLRIYSQNATIPHMLEYLREEVGAKQMITIGTRPEAGISVPAGAPNRVVRALRRQFEPFFWEREKS